MTLVGYKKLTIQVLNDDLTPKTGSKYVVQGDANKGGTSTFEITGLSKEPIKAYGSDKIYHVEQRGIGDIKANFGLLDLPFEVEQEILGVKKSTNGVYHEGSLKNPPYCAVLCESADLQGNKVGFGMYAGKFGRDAISAETLSEGNFTPSPDDYTYVPISKKINGEEETVGKAFDTEAFTALETELFGATGEGN